MAASFNRIDHIVILVKNLDDGIATYRGLGFNVTPGGEHPGGTHNALVPFQDGTYLELIAFQQPEKPHEHRWYPFLATGGGIVDFCLGVDDVAEAVSGARSRGLDCRGPVPGARTRPDGVQVSWRLGQPPAGHTGEIPFFIDDVTPREVRVPGGDAAVHPNGVVGVRFIVIATGDVQATSELYGKLLDKPTPPPSEGGEQPGAVATYGLGKQRIVVVKPSRPGSPIAERIEQRGNGPFEIVMAAEGLDSERLIEPDTAEGARILIQPA